jgi:branched-chain amino acid transport system substrate-binding protein
VARLVYDEQVWAIVGAPDGPSAHLVAQVVAKARLPFLSPVATDKTTNLANVPWVFSLAPGDNTLAPLLAEVLVSRTRGRSFAVVSCTDHDARVFTAELLSALTRLEAFPSLHIAFNPGETRFEAQLHRIGQTRPAAIVVAAGPQDAAAFLVALRRKHPTLPVFGGPAMGRRAFVESAGRNAEGVVFPLLWDPSTTDPRSAGFVRRFRERFAADPDYTAAHTYDAMHLLIAAIRQAGLNRPRIRDAVRALSPQPGVTGTITWDPTGHNTRPVGLGTIRNGQAVPQHAHPPG